jgi:hypothetical protein
MAEGTREKVMDGHTRTRSLNQPDGSNSSMTTEAINEKRPIR